MARIKWDSPTFFVRQVISWIALLHYIDIAYYNSLNVMKQLRLGNVIRLVNDRAPSLCHDAETRLESL